MGTKLLGLSIARGSGALKGLMQGAFFLVWAPGPSAGGSYFGSICSPGLSRQVGWPSADFASRLADSNNLVWLTSPTD